MCRISLCQPPTPLALAADRLTELVGPADFAFDFYVADDLGLTPARAAELAGLAHGPWELKPVFGMLSDAFPIRGYRRGPYIVIFCLLGSSAILYAGLMPPPSASSIGLLGVLLWLANLASE